MNSLRLRLFAAFFAVIILTLAIVGLALLLILRNSPLIDRTAVTRLNTVARVLAQQTPLAAAASPAQLTAAAQRLSQTHDLRVLVMEAGGAVRVDTQAEAPALRPNLRLSRPSAVVSGARQGQARDAAGAAWTYLAQPLGDGRFVVLAIAQPRFPALAFFMEDLFWPLAQAGAIAAAAALALAVLIARSVAGPLQKMAVVAQGIARGDYTQSAPTRGPDEVRALGQALNSMAAQIQATQTAQHDFLGNVSHELKTPLTSIQGFAQAIQDGAADSPEAVQRSAGIIYDEANRMRRLVEELLELTRLDAGLRALRREPVDLRALLAATLERFQLRAQAKQITLSADLPAALPVIKGDADRLAQVFTNLMDNALKHTPAGGRVALAAGPVPEGVQVSVADTGAGIPAEDLGRVFERFYQVDKSRARSGGVGLGLAITKEIVQAHRGAIHVESVVGLGTRFTVRLPLAWPEDSTIARRRSESHS